MIRFYATVDSDSIRSYMPQARYLIPASSFWRKGWTIPRLPEGSEIGVDCGGYVMTKKYGTYPYSFADYDSWVADVPGVQWAAMPDYCCEDDLTAPEPGVYVASTAIRQMWTAQAARYFLEQYGHRPWAWVPTIQGWNVEDYRYHAQRLRPLITELQRWYAEYGNYDYFEGDEDDPVAVTEFERRWKAGPAFRVAIGTLCRRASRQLIREIVETVSHELPGVPLHLWGVKIAGLSSHDLPSSVVSVDSAAWNGRWGAGIERQRKSGLTQREYSYRVALPEYTRKFEASVNGRAIGFKKTLDTR